MRTGDLKLFIAAQQRHQEPAASGASSLPGRSPQRSPAQDQRRQKIRAVNHLPAWSGPDGLQQQGLP
jgi:hypothetical protein